MVAAVVQVSYRSYWTRMILHTLHTHGHNLSIKEISERTAIRTDDIVTTLQSLSLIKYWKGDHIIAVNSKQASLYRCHRARLVTSSSSACSCVIAKSMAITDGGPSHSALCT